MKLKAPRGSRCGGWEVCRKTTRRRRGILRVIFFLYENMDRYKKEMEFE